MMITTWDLVIVTFVNGIVTMSSQWLFKRHIEHHIDRYEEILREQFKNKKEGTEEK